MAAIGKQTWAPFCKQERERESERQAAALVAANMEMLYRYI